ncbi:MAG: DNA-protecting protein DprA, partial [bacterium]
TQQAEKIAFELAELGIAVISGLALGIDAAAHRGALSARGKTIAILGCGVDVVYPGEHKDLYDQIARDGLIVSEYPPGTEPHAAHFPERNRIISGLSHGVFVAEAARKSGALLTARHAVEQGREVFALPGLATNPQCKGCHHLIKTGQASLVENADDILIALNLSKEELLFGRQAKPKQMTIGYSAEDESEGEIEMEVDRSGYTPAGLSPEERRVLELVSYEGTHINEVARETKMSIAELSAHLTMLEIRGLVTSTSGGYYQRV